MASAPQNPQPPARDLFDRQRRAIRRARGKTRCKDQLPDGYIEAQMSDMLLERLGDVTRQFGDILLIGARLPQLATQLAANGARVTILEANADLASAHGAVHGHEDLLPVEPESYDLIIWPGGLESVNDVPGALLRCRFALKPDGLLIGCFVGDGSLPALRRALTAADAERPVARMSPQIEVRAIGDLLTRAGFALAVADTERLSLSYPSLLALIHDLRAAALTNMLGGDVPQMTRSAWARACAAFAGGQNAAGRVVETLRIVHFSGWAPHPDQPKAAKRGSATASLSAALRPADKS